jgi:hypothetical protein
VGLRLPARPRLESGEDSYVLCEINVSSVSPFPASAVAPLALASVAQARAVRRGRAPAR